jgi:hypothetical protein
MVHSLILKRAPIGDNQDDYDVLENGVVVGRIFTVSTAPQDRHWMWASGRDCNLRRAAHGYEATREAAMAADDGLVRGLPTTPAVISSPDCLPCPPCPA